MDDLPESQEVKDTATPTTTTTDVLKPPGGQPVGSGDIDCQQEIQIRGRALLVGARRKRIARSEQRKHPCEKMRAQDVHPNDVGKPPTEFHTAPQVIEDAALDKVIETNRASVDDGGDDSDDDVKDELHETETDHYRPAHSFFAENSVLPYLQEGTQLYLHRLQQQQQQQQQHQQQNKQLQILGQQMQFHQGPQLRHQHLHNHHQQQQQQQQPLLHVPPFPARQQVPLTLPAIQSPYYVHQMGGMQPPAMDFRSANQSFPVPGHQVFSQIPLHFPPIVSNQLNHQQQQQQQTSVPLAHEQTRYINYDPQAIICNQNFIQHIEWQMLEVQKQQLRQQQQHHHQHHQQQQQQQQTHLQQLPYQNSAFNHTTLVQQQQQQHQQPLQFIHARQVIPKMDKFLPQDQQPVTSTDCQTRTQPQSQTTPLGQKKHSGSESQVPGASTQGVNLYVKHLDDDVDDNALRKMFSRFGEVISAKVMMEGQRSRGFGFVCFAKPEDAARATRDIRRKTDDLSTKNLYVAPAQRKEERQAFFREKLKSMMDGIAPCPNQENEPTPQLLPAKEGNNGLDMRTATRVKFPDHTGHIKTPAGENAPNVSQDSLTTLTSDRIRNVRHITDHSRSQSLKAGSSGSPSSRLNHQKNIFDLDNFSLEKLTKPLLRPANFPDSNFRILGLGHESESEPIPDSFFDADDEDDGSRYTAPQQQDAGDNKQDDVNSCQGAVAMHSSNPWGLRPDLYPGMASDLLHPNVFGDAATPVIDGVVGFDGQHNKISENTNTCKKEAVNDWSLSGWNPKQENPIQKELAKEAGNCSEHLLDCHDLVTDCIACCTDTESLSSAEEEYMEPCHPKRQCRKNDGFSPVQRGQNNSNVDSALMLILKYRAESISVLTSVGQQPSSEREYYCVYSSSNGITRTSNFSPPKEDLKNGLDKCRKRKWVSSEEGNVDVGALKEAKQRRIEGSAQKQIKTRNNLSVPKRRIKILFNSIPNALLIASR